MSLPLSLLPEEMLTPMENSSDPFCSPVDLGKGVKLELVLIPADEFLMGSPDSDKDADADENPQHRVRITKPFYLGNYQVAQEQWEAVMGNKACRMPRRRSQLTAVKFEAKMIVETGGPSGSATARGRLLLRTNFRGRIIP